MAQTEEYTPSLAGSIGAAVLSVVMGGLLAAVNLAFLPVSVVKELPVEEDLDTKAVYYIAGEEKGGNTWKSKQTVLEKGRKAQIKITEGELNRWARTSFKPDPKAESEEEGMLGRLKFVPGIPNFRILEDALQISAQLSLPLLPGSKAFTYQARGHFSNADGGYRFVAEDGFIGSCPIPTLVGLPDKVFAKLSRKYLFSEAYEKLNPAWMQLSGVRIEKKELDLTLP